MKILLSFPSYKYDNNGLVSRASPTSSFWMCKRRRRHSCH